VEWVQCTARLDLLRLGFATAALRADGKVVEGHRSPRHAGVNTMAPGLAQRLGVRRPAGALANSNGVVSFSPALERSDYAG
jgi:hypothetical protein